MFFSLLYCSSNDRVILPGSFFAVCHNHSTCFETISTDSSCVFAFKGRGDPEHQGYGRGHLGRRGCRRVCDCYFCLHRTGCAGHSVDERSLSHLKISHLHFLSLMKPLKFFQLILSNLILSFMLLVVPDLIRRTSCRLGTLKHIFSFHRR